MRLREQMGQAQPGLCPLGLPPMSGGGGCGLWLAAPPRLREQMGQAQPGLCPLGLPPMSGGGGCGLWLAAPPRLREQMGQAQPGLCPLGRPLALLAAVPPFSDRRIAALTAD